MADDNHDSLNDAKKLFKVIAIDLDGVLAHFELGWKGGAFIDRPLVGAAEFTEKLRLNGWKIIIFTTRFRTDVVEKWLLEHGIAFDTINKNIYDIAEESDKVVADVYLDDRAVKFTGDYMAAFYDVERFKPWYFKEAEH